MNKNKIMKKILYISLALVALVGCKQAQQEPTPDTPTPEGAILVRSGGVLSVDLTKAGARPIADGTFVLKTESTPGDKIGVLGVYSTNPLTDPAEAGDLPNWAKYQFENLPAEATKANAAAGVTDFVWSDGTQYQFFDKGNYIHMFAYYPYANGTSASEGVQYVTKTVGDAGAKPEIQVELLDETITEGDTEKLKQPDVMFAQHADGLLIADGGSTPAPKPINRKSLEPNMRLKFQHVLAQLNFKIMKAKEVKGDVYLQQIIIKVPKSGKYVLGNGMTPTVTLPTDDAHYATYTVTPTATADGLLVGEFEADKSTAVPVNGVPLMMFPFTQSELQECKVTMKLKFEKYGIVNFPLSTSGNDNTMNLDAFGGKGLKQGATNTITMTVNHVGISLQGSVAAWGEKVHGDDIVLD